MFSNRKEVRTIAIAIVVLGFLAELTGIVLLAADRGGAAAIAVMVTGLLVVMLGLVLIGTSRQQA